MKNINFNSELDTFKAGLYGQILTWVLEILPYLDENNILPDWDLKCSNYGEAPDHKIFGKHMLLNYTPNNLNDEYVNFFDFKTRPETSSLFHNYAYDFQKAHDMFFKYFSISDEINNEVESFFSNRKGKRNLGIHYRGTDKINSSESGYMDEKIFVTIVDDYLASNNDIDTIFVISDEKEKIIFISEYYKNKGYNVHYPDDSVNLPVSNLLFSNYGNSGFDTSILHKKSIVDPLILSKCDVLFKSQSALSCWAKIFNPNIEAYRITSFKYNWFPDGYIERYTSKDHNIQHLLNKIYSEENCWHK